MIKAEIWNYIFWITLGYCSGSILYAYLLPKLFLHIDITRSSPDGNPGVFNAFSLAGVPVGVAALILELAKGFVPVFFASNRLAEFNFAFSLVMLSPVAGHMFPLWRKFSGGKAVAVSFGVLLGLLPHCRAVWYLAFFYIIFSAVIIINPHSFRSFLVYICFGVSCIIFIKPFPVLLGCIFIACFVSLRHFSAYRAESRAQNQPEKIQIKVLRKFI